MELIAAALSPYILAVLISLTVGLYALRRSEVPGNRAFAVFTFCETAWMAGFVGELFAHTLAAKVFWDNLQFLPAIGAPCFYLIFVYRYSGARFRFTRVWLGLLIGLAVLLAAAVFTDPLHGLLRLTSWVKPGKPFSALLYDMGPVMWLYYAYSVVCVVAGVVLLATRLIQPGHLFRGQVLVLMLASVVPTVGGALSMAGISFGLQRDMSPYSFTFTNLLLFWGLFRFRLLRIAPMARDRVLEIMREALIVLDSRHVVIDMNVSAERLLQLPRAKTLGQDAHAALGRFPALLAVLEGERGAPMEISIVSGKVERIYEVDRVDQPDEQGRRGGVILLLHDVTRLKTTEREAMEASRELERLYRELQESQAESVVRERLAAMGELTGSVSHELRNPLGTVRNSLFSLRDALQQGDSSRQLRALELADRNLKRIEELVDELLEFGRSRELLRTDTDLDAFVRQVLEAEEIPEGISLSMQLGSKIHLSLDREMIQRAIHNIVENAVQAMQRSVSDQGTLAIETSVGQDRAGITVSDNGPGIDPDHLGRLFEPLFTTRQQGFGLGMSIVRKIFRAHGGDVEVASRPGEGARVLLWLPIEESDIRSVP